MALLLLAAGTPALAQTVGALGLTLDITSAPASGNTYGLHEAIEVTATFDEVVTLRGDAQASLQVGAGSRVAVYDRGSGTRRLVFRYVVRAGDVDADGVTIRTNALDAEGDPSMGVQGGGTIEGADSRLAADLTSDEVPNITGHQVNGALASVPSAPTNLTATANGHTRIDLSWTLPRHHGAGAIAGYRIEVSFDAGASWSDLVADTGGNGRAYHHTGLSAETSRHYCVSAINPAGTGPASNVDDATTAAAPATPEPRVSISADHASFIFALDDVRFTLTLAAAAGADLSVLVTLSQDQTMLPASALTRIATIGEGKTSGVLLVRSHLFTGNPTDSGTLTATVIDGGGYEPARPATASTSIRVADPAMTIRLEHARYHVAEAAGSVEVVAIAETAPGVLPPRGTHFFALSTEARTAEAGTDFETAVAFVLIQPADYRELGGVFMAEKTLAVSILDDEQDDDDEYFVVMLERGPGLSLVIHLVAPDQAACTPDPNRPSSTTAPLCRADVSPSPPARTTAPHAAPGSPRPLSPSRPWSHTPPAPAGSTPASAPP